MSYSVRSLTFREPLVQDVALNPTLAKTIHELSRRQRESLFHLCMIAYGLRKHNLVKTKTGAGGNAQGFSYKPQFSGWYVENDLEEVYGKLPNFLCYAMAGRLLTYVRWQLGEQYIARLPATMTALYALSRILWDQGDQTDSHRRDLFQRALIAPIRDGTKRNTFINPHLTVREIDVWLETQSGKTGTSKITKQNESIPGCSIVLAEIKVHRNLFKFTKAHGEKRTGPDLPDVEELVELIRDLVKKFDDGKSRYDVASHLVEIRQSYREAKNPAFGKKLVKASQTV